MLSVAGACCCVRHCALGALIASHLSRNAANPVWTTQCHPSNKPYRFRVFRCDRGYSLHLLLRLSGRPDLVHPRPGIAVRLSCKGIIILFALKPLEESQPLAWCIVSADSEAEARQAANDQSTRSRSCRLTCSRDSRVQASGANWWFGASERRCRFFCQRADVAGV
jgi:hypothetical protein